MNCNFFCYSYCKHSSVSVLWLPCILPLYLGNHKHRQTVGEMAAAAATRRAHCCSLGKILSLTQLQEMWKGKICAFKKEQDLIFSWIICFIFQFYRERKHWSLSLFSWQPWGVELSKSECPSAFCPVHRNTTQHSSHHSLNHNTSPAWKSLHNLRR